MIIILICQLILMFSDLSHPSSLHSLLHASFQAVVAELKPVADACALAQIAVRLQASGLNLKLNILASIHS
jgi:hypothetical protein